MFYLKIHKNRFGREVLAVCDEDILGKTFEDGEICFEVKKDFYNGDKVTEEEAENFLIVSQNFNLIGKKIIALALRIKLIDKENIIKIKGVPYAQGHSI